MSKTNPFRPNYPTSPGMFVGRVEEIERIERHLLQTKDASPTNFLLTGERGIGKTSLLNYVKWTAQGDIPIDDQKLHFLVIDTDVDPSTTHLGLIRKIELGIRKQLAQTEKGRAFVSEAWSFLKKIEAGGYQVGSSGA